ncbi:hypothetical protein P8452_20312 [Trifolium repens]|nr:hypothetical protein P8452_20312 [Trifolium repens]
MIFLFLFLVATNINGGSGLFVRCFRDSDCATKVATNVEATFIKCITDSDCPKDMCPNPRMKPKCFDARICKCITKLYPET